MKMQKRKLIAMLFMVGAMCVSVLCFSKNVQAATSGTIPCSKGSVSWTLDDEGVLTFSGSGTTDIAKTYQQNSYTMGRWNNYWEATELDVSQVTSVVQKKDSVIKLDTCEYMYYGFKNCISIDLSGFDFSSITNFNRMFYDCSSLKKLDVSMLDTSEVTSTYYMFGNCSSLEELDVTNFDTGKVRSMSGMFYGCSSLTTLDVSNFDTSNVTYISAIFAYCSSLVEIDVSKFDTSNVGDMQWMFYGCEALTNLDVTNFDTSNVYNMSSMFGGCKNLKALDVSKFNTSNVEYFTAMFDGCEMLTTLDVSSFDTSKAESMSAMFSHCTSLITIDVSNFDTRNVTNMYGVFMVCSSLTKLDVSNFDTSNVTDMMWMFRDCTSLKELDVKKFNTSNVESMYGMFSGCESLTKLDVTNFNTSNVTEMDHLFADCTSLKELDVTNFDTKNVTHTLSMFSGCTSLKELDVTNFDTSNVTNMYGMFEDCTSLTELDVTNFNTANVTSMWWMFKGCTSLKELDVTNFNTTNVTTMWGLFEGCASLISLDVSNFDTSNVQDMSWMFSGCTSLVTLDLSNFDTGNVTSMGNIFEECTSLKMLDISSFDMSNITINQNQLFITCDSLEMLVTPATETLIYLERREDKLWVDSANNIYDYIYKTFENSTTLYLVNEKYNIYYVHNGELVDCPTTFSVKEGLSEFGSVKYQYGVFDGWYMDMEYTVPVETIEIGTNGDITLYAKMIPNSYSITYKNIENATNPEVLFTEYTYGQEYELPMLTAKCYAFKGWYLDEECTEEFASITSDVGGDLTLYAKWEEAHDYDLTDGTIIKEATTTEEGIIQYQCKNCTNTITDTIQKLQESDVKEPSDKNNDETKPSNNNDYATNSAKPSDENSDATKTDDENSNTSQTTLENIIKELGISNDTIAITDDTIISMVSEKDVKGSLFYRLQARAKKTMKKSIRLTWKRINGADGYLVYGSKCGKKNKYQLIKTIKNGKRTSYTQKKLKKGTYYKYIVRAYKVIDGKKVTIAASKTIHATTTGGKYGNAKNVKVNRTKLSLKKNKKFTLKASEVKKSKKIRKHRAVAFESGNKDIATVSKKGVIKAKSKGKCYIYAYAQNGAFKKIKVTVK